MSRLVDELRRVFGDPPVAPRAVVRVHVGSGQDLASGRAEADRLVDAGADLVVLDTETTSAQTLVALALLLDLEPVAVVGIEESEDWRTQVLVVRTGLREARRHIGDPEQLVHELADPVLARTTGLLAQLGERHTPVLCGGGTTTAAAALLAQCITPQAARWWVAGSQPTHPAAAKAWRSLDLQPLLDLRLDQGSADVAAALVRAGLDVAGA